VSFFKRSYLVISTAAEKSLPAGQRQECGEKRLEKSGLRRKISPFRLRSSRNDKE
jgi:hypothetical protein